MEGWNEREETKRYFERHNPSEKKECLKKKRSKRYKEPRKAYCVLL